MSERNTAEFWFDPLCPWAWMTSRWMMEVEKVRPVDVTWSVMSLSVLNEGRAHLSEHYRGLMHQGWGPVRVVIAAREKYGDDIVKPLYDALGERIHHQQQDYPTAIAGALEALDLPAELADAATTDEHDEALRASHQRAIDLVGDDVGTPVDEGEEGELYLGGEQVARGYLNRLELTRHRFVADPFLGTAGARMYRTGDRVRWNDEGELEFLGRRDLQIQLHGRRVELGEIEALLHEHPQVVEACCTAVMSGDKSIGIAAHVVARSQTEGLSDELRRHLAAKLPSVLIPGKILVYDRLPRSASGKVDRMLLKSVSSAAMPGASAAEAGESLRESLLRLWCNALSLGSDPPQNATFWDLGGDSMAAVQLILEVHDLIGQQFPVSDFLVNPTLSGLYQIVDDVFTRGSTPVLEFRRGGTRPPLFCLYGAWGDVGVYTDLANALGRDQPVFGVRSPALTSGEAVSDSLEDAAARVVSLIRSTTNAAAPALLGYSWGGLLAFEVARQWTSAGGRPMFVGLIGSLPPSHEVTNAVRFQHFLRWFPRAAWHVLSEKSTWKKHMFRLRELANRTIATMRPKANIEPPLPYWARNPLSRAHFQLSNRYHPKVSTPIDLNLVREQGAFTTFPHPLRPLDRSHLPDCGWSVWSKKPVVIHLIDAEHRDVMRPPKVHELAAMLREAMHRHYGREVAQDAAGSGQLKS